MTAPTRGGADEIREQMAAVLRLHPDLPVLWPSSDKLADALLPTVQALIAKGAAAELRDMADRLARAHDVGPARRLRNRADALDGTQ